MPVVTAHSEHVSVGLIEVIVGHRNRRLERVVLLTTSLVALALMSWRLWVKAGELAACGDGTSYLNVPLALFAYFMSLMSALAAIVVGLQIAEVLSVWRHCAKACCFSSRPRARRCTLRRARSP